jgi:uncharacterized protein YndB with AHSA1/START domain
VDPFHHHIHLPCTPERAFEMFTQDEHLEDWLTEKASVEPSVGGKYELFWDCENPEVDSTLGCRITAYAPGMLLAFDWKGPQKFAALMNDADPLTHVVIAFFPSTQGTELYLLHSGWRQSGPWPKVKAYFERAWENAPKTLQAQLAASG